MVGGAGWPAKYLAPPTSSPPSPVAQQLTAVDCCSGGHPQHPKKNQPALTEDKNRDQPITSQNTFVFVPITSGSFLFLSVINLSQPSTKRILLLCIIRHLKASKDFSGDSDFYLQPHGPLSGPRAPPRSPPQPHPGGVKAPPHCRAAGRAALSRINRLGRLQSAGRAASSWPPGATTEAIATRRHKAQRWNPSQPAATLSGQRRSCSKALPALSWDPVPATAAGSDTSLPPSPPPVGGESIHWGMGGSSRSAKWGIWEFFSAHGVIALFCTVLQFAVWPEEFPPPPLGFGEAGQRRATHLTSLFVQHTQ